MTNQPPPLTDPTIIRKICATPTPAKMDVVLKFSELPKARFGAGVVSFALDADGCTILVEVKRKTWQKLETAVAEWPQWVATVQGQMGEPIEGGFMLINPGLQVFQKQPKLPKEEPATSQLPENPVKIAVESTLEVAPPKQTATYPKLSLKSKKSGA
jgi:hypothetical protein